MTPVYFKNLLSFLETKNCSFSLYNSKAEPVDYCHFEDFSLTHFVQHTKDSHGEQTLFAFLPGKTLPPEDLMREIFKEKIAVVVVKEKDFFHCLKKNILPKISQEDEDTSCQALNNAFCPLGNHHNKTSPENKNDKKSKTLSSQDRHKDPLFLVVPDISFVKILGLLGTQFFPHSPPYSVAVTGTDGKTSLVHFLHQLWEKNDYPHLTFGTLGIKGSYEEKGNIIHLDMNLPNRGCTTPPGSFLYSFLSRHPLVKHMAVEASSQGLHQQRLLGFPFYLGIFTNFTQDHLDYHKSQKAYGEAKMELFQNYVTHKALFHLSLLSHFHLHGVYSSYFYGPKDLYENLRQHYSFLSSLCVGYYEILRSKPFGNQVRFSFPFLQESYELFLPLLGEFQVSNVLGALMAFHLTGGSLSKIMPHVAHLKNVPGRMELIRHWKGASIYIDYAHTEKALEQALMTLRDHGQGRILLVFGCGGDRDKTKRQPMGTVAQELADIVVITDDNPRQEDPRDIRREILHHCPKGIEIPDRTAAIAWAMDQLNPGDSLLIAGKGHEKVQIIGQEYFFHSDHYCVGSFFDDPKNHPQAS